MIKSKSGIWVCIEVRISYFVDFPRLFCQSLVIVLGRALTCRFATFEIVLCGFLTLSILHEFSTVATLVIYGYALKCGFLTFVHGFSMVTQPLVVVLGRAGLQPLKLCHMKL